MAKALKIKEVSYRTNVDVGSFRRKHLEATASVGPGQKPEKVLLDLARWVHGQLGISAPACPPRSVRDLGDE